MILPTVLRMVLTSLSCRLSGTSMVCASPTSVLTLLFVLIMSATVSHQCQTTSECSFYCTQSYHVY